MRHRESECVRCACLFRVLKTGLRSKAVVRCFRFMQGGGSWDHHASLEMNKHTREINGRHMAGLWFTSVHSRFLPFLQKFLLRKQEVPPDWGCRTFEPFNGTFFFNFAQRKAHAACAQDSGCNIRDTNEQPNGILAIQLHEHDGIAT
jgi:hypothetical protein